jgi:hypothetical protein
MKLDHDTCDIVCEEMLKVIEMHMDGELPPFISFDPIIERLYRKKMIKAAKRIHDYYNLPERYLLGTN